MLRGAGSEDNAKKKTVRGGAVDPWVYGCNGIDTLVTWDPRILCCGLHEEATVMTVRVSGFSRRSSIHPRNSILHRENVFRTHVYDYLRHI